MLVPLESSSAVLVMIRIKSVSICNRSRAGISYVLYNSFCTFSMYCYNLIIHGVITQRVIVKLYGRPALMSVCSSGSPPSEYRPTLVQFDSRVIIFFFFFFFRSTHILYRICKREK